jgi:hypothetical protein
MSGQPLQVEPDELVRLAALEGGASEAGSVLSRQLIEAFRHSGYLDYIRTDCLD